MTSKRGYITLYLSTVAVGILCVEGFNALVDPSALWSPVKGGIERTRVLDAGGRLFTSARLARGDWQSVILGSSRCLRGIDPRSPYFVGLRTFDACLSGTNMAEMAPIAEFALAHNPQLKRVLIGLDFEMFTARRTMSSDYDASMLSGKSTTEVTLEYLLSWQTLRRSFSTLADYFSGRRTDVSDDGSVDMTILPPKMTPRGRFDDVLKNGFLLDAASYGAFEYSRRRIADLSRVLAEYKKAGVVVDMYVSPSHARQMEAIYALGLGHDYEIWLADIAVVARDNGAKLVDFSGFNSITTEPVPPIGSTVEMRWYWESSHFRRETGELILKRLSEISDTTSRNHARDASDFGRPLVATTVLLNVAALHEGRQRYAREQPQEVADVVNLVRQTAVRRAQLRAAAGQAIRD